jgi:hypothetical protein
VSRATGEPEGGAARNAGGDSWNCSQATSWFSGRVPVASALRKETVTRYSAPGFGDSRGISRLTRADAPGAIGGRAMGRPAMAIPSSVSVHRARNPARSMKECRFSIWTARVEGSTRVVRMGW